MIDLFKPLLAQLPKRTGSKWGGGIGLLWRGNCWPLYKRAVKATMFSRGSSSEVSSSCFLFESSRVAIYQYAKSIGLCAEDRVQILGFTCDAVTDAIKPFCSKITLYDCDESLRCQNFTLMQDTKLLICQVTFGVTALPEDVLTLAASRGVKILLDKSLSYGTQDFSATDVCKYPEVLSFEVSKSFTIGWGGRLRLPEEQVAEFNHHYSTLGVVPLWDDLSRVFSVTLNLYMVKHGGILAYLLWALFRVFGLHRLSAKSSSSKYHNKSIMGAFSRKILTELIGEIPVFLRRSNENHFQLKTSLEKAGLRVISFANEDVSTPRISFLVDKTRKLEIQRWFAEHNIELGCWFDSFPLREDEFDRKDFPGCDHLMSSVVNLPCHGSLDALEISLMCTCIEELSFSDSEKNV